MSRPIAALAALVTLFYAARSLAELKQHFRGAPVETIFVERYWTLMDGLSLVAVKGCSQPIIDPADEKIVLQYFRLSEDELELHAEGWISDRTWTAWRAGIVAQISRWPFFDVWTCERSLPG